MLFIDLQTHIVPLCNTMNNLGHSILEPYNVLVLIRLTTSKTKCDI